LASTKASVKSFADLQSVLEDRDKEKNVESSTSKPIVEKPIIVSAAASALASFVRTRKKST
jgi:hypothetical protein